MTVNELQQKYANQFIKIDKPDAQKKDVPSFSDTLHNLVEETNATHEASVEKIKDFVAGKDVHLHEVMAAGQEAEVTFQFLLEVRNKLLEAYQEISRTQV